MVGNAPRRGDFNGRRERAAALSLGLGAAECFAARSFPAGSNSGSTRQADRGRFGKMEHETRFELATGLTASTRHSLIARGSPFRWQRVTILEFIDVYEVYRA